MYVRVITMRYSEGLQGFPEDALRQATLGHEVLAVEQHFFTHGNVPHLALVLSLADLAPADPKSGKKLSESRVREHQEEESLPEGSRAAYRALKAWRNEILTRDGVPSSAVARNTQLLALVKAAPQTLAAMREVSGITEKFCKTYGVEVLSALEGLLPVREAETQGGEGAAEPQ